MALGLGTVSGNLKRLKDDFDPRAAGASEKMPKFAYDMDRIRDDGKVFFDLIRKPSNDACYYCHTNLDADAVTGSRWLHDEDIHIRADIACADCHRNGLDHQTVRGFEGEVHLDGISIASLTCQGCHVGNPSDSTSSTDIAGRLGAPRPEHRGIPPLHFDKLSCTVCHSGPLPQMTAPRLVNSIVHRLGEHQRRTGLEWPAIIGPVMLPTGSATASMAALPAAKYMPNRLFWPSYWATMKDGEIKPLHPAENYELLRGVLKVRRDFNSELAEVKLPLSKRSEVIGAERAKAEPDELTADETSQLAAAESELRTEQIRDRLAEALTLIEQKYPESVAIFISGGSGFLKTAEGGFEELKTEAITAAADYVAWPLAHNVRPATQSWGVTGCTECHGYESPFFGAEVLPVGLVPNQTIAAFPIHQRQQVDMVRMDQCSQMFAGRSAFKFVSFAALGLTIAVVMSAWLSGRSSSTKWVSGWRQITAPDRSGWLSRWSLWGLVIASIVVTASMLMSMLPLLDTTELRQATWVHRYAGIVVILMAITHSIGRFRTATR